MELVKGWLRRGGLLSSVFAICPRYSHLHWALAPPEEVAGNVGFRVLLPDCVLQVMDGAK